MPYNSDARRVVKYIGFTCALTTTGFPIIETRLSMPRHISAVHSNQVPSLGLSLIDTINIMGLAFVDVSASIKACTGIADSDVLTYTLPSVHIISETSPIHVSTLATT